MRLSNVIASVIWRPARYVMCHDSHFSLYAFHATHDTPAWKARPAPPIATVSACAPACRCVSCMEGQLSPHIATVSSCSPTCLYVPWKTLCELYRLCTMSGCPHPPHRPWVCRYVSVGIVRAVCTGLSCMNCGYGGAQLSFLHRHGHAELCSLA